MKYQLNVYGKDSEILKTVGADFVPTGLFIRALKMGEEIQKEGKSEIDAFGDIVKIVLDLFPDLTEKELMNSCDIGDVINVFKQIIARAKEINSKN